MDVLEGLIKFFLNFFPHFLGREIVGIIVTRAEYIGSRKNSALYFRSKLSPCRTVLFYKGLPGSTKSVTHSVIPGKIRARLGRGDDVVAGEAVGNGIFERNRHQFRPRILADPCSVNHRCLQSGIHVFSLIFLNEADA